MWFQQLRGLSDGGFTAAELQQNGSLKSINIFWKISAQSK